ncbi:MAG: A/G-specific adenine glycosylase [Lachnospiraceae bacterium]
MEYRFKDIKKPLLEWYMEYHRKLPWRQDTNPYKVWVSEIMLQQTRVEAVKDYYNRFMKECPDIESLAHLSDERLMKLWEGLGYYNRARNLKKSATLIVDEYNGNFPSAYEDVLALPGIGEYTAGAICSICFNEKTPAVDGNVLRVMTRLANWYAIIDEQKTKRQAREYLLSLYEDGDCGLITQGLMELGATVCIPNGVPKCSTCPLRSFCNAYKLGTYDRLPVRKEKKPPKEIDMTVFILHDKDTFGICKRPEHGLLANMWQFFNVEEKLTTEQAILYVSDFGFEPVEVEKMIKYTHVFTHVKWNMEAYYIKCNCKNDKLTWVKKSELTDTYALPTAFRVLIQ